MALPFKCSRSSHLKLPCPFLRLALPLAMAGRPWQSLRPFDGDSASHHRPCRTQVRPARHAAPRDPAGARAAALERNLIPEQTDPDTDSFAFPGTAPSGSHVHTRAEDASAPSGYVAGKPRRDFDSTAAARAAVSHTAGERKPLPAPRRRALGTALAVVNAPASACQASGRRRPGRSALALVLRVRAAAGSPPGLSRADVRCILPA